MKGVIIASCNGEWGHDAWCYGELCYGEWCGFIGPSSAPQSIIGSSPHPWSVIGSR